MTFMPIEIRELVIRAVAETRPEPRRPGAPDQARAEPLHTVDEAFVARCVREVLRELNRSRAR